MSEIQRAARIMGKSYDFVRIGLQRGLLPFGTAIKTKDSNKKYNYYISPKLFKDFTGFELYGEDEETREKQ